MSHPTLINLPPPPSDTPTPSEVGPSTPNSGTTSLSALSTTAIKDGHRGKLHPHGHKPRRPSDASDTSTDTLAAERADRISRLAGLGPNDSTDANLPLPGYFDPTHAHLYQKERSTVGSASATGSVGGRTTWASGSDIFDQDKINDDDGVSSVMSDENASLVGFGEGASSTISGPISARIPTVSRQSSGLGTSNRLSAGPGGPTASQNLSPQTEQIPPSSPSPAGSTTPQGPDYDPDDARMVDGVTFDENVVDTTIRPPQPVTASTSERA